MASEAVSLVVVTAPGAPVVSDVPASSSTLAASSALAVPSATSVRNSMSLPTDERTAVDQSGNTIYRSQSGNTIYRSGVFQDFGVVFRESKQNICFLLAISEILTILYLVLAGLEYVDCTHARASVMSGMLTAIYGVAACIESCHEVNDHCVEFLGQVSSNMCEQSCVVSDHVGVQGHCASREKSSTCCFDCDHSLGAAPMVFLVFMLLAYGATIGYIVFEVMKKRNVFRAVSVVFRTVSVVYSEGKETVLSLLGISIILTIAYIIFAWQYYNCIHSRASVLSGMLTAMYGYPVCGPHDWNCYEVNDHCVQVQEYPESTSCEDSCVVGPDVHGIHGDCTAGIDDCTVCCFDCDHLMLKKAMPPIFLVLMLLYYVGTIGYIVVNVMNKRAGRDAFEPQLLRVMEPPLLRNAMDHRGVSHAARTSPATAFLEAWLADLGLGPYTEAAKRWCEDQGAIHLEEIAQNKEDFAAALGLKPLERNRFIRSCEAETWPKPPSAV